MPVEPVALDPDQVALIRSAVHEAIWESKKYLYYADEEELAEARQTLADYKALDDYLSDKWLYCDRPRDAEE